MASKNKNIEYLSIDEGEKDTIKWKIYPEEFCLLNEKEKQLLSTLANDPSIIYNYGYYSNLFEDFIKTLPQNKINSIMKIEFTNSDSKISSNLLTLLISAFLQTLDPKLRESLIKDIEQIINRSVESREVFIKNFNKFDDFRKSGHQEIRGRLDTLLETCKNNRKKPEGKLPFKNLKGILELKKTNGRYSYIKLGTNHIQFSIKGLEEAKLEYYNFLEDKLNNRLEYTKRFNIGLILCFVIFNSNKLKVNPKNKKETIGIFNLSDPNFKESFNKIVTLFKKNLDGFTTQGTDKFIDYIPYVRKILERCRLQKKIKITIKHKSECSISIFLGSK